MHVDVGNGVTYNIPDPRSFENGGLVWRLTYSDPVPIRLAAAAVINDLNSLLSSDMSSAEACRRLRVLRGATIEAVVETEAQNTN